MNAEMGEYLVGAYLKVVEKCDFIGYNVRPPGGGLKGLEELDVVGPHFDDQTAFLCEVTTHIGGLLYKDYPTTVNRIGAKHLRQKNTRKVIFRIFRNENTSSGHRSSRKVSPISSRESILISTSSSIRNTRAASSFSVLRLGIERMMKIIRPFGYCKYWNTSADLSEARYSFTL